MPHKPTGGKNGRPRKSATTPFSAKQNLYIEMAGEAPGLSSAEYARRLNVTRSAVSKWANDPFIARQIDRQHSMRVGMQIAKNLKARDKAIEVAVEEELEREANQRATSITAWVNSNWPGDDKIKVPFPGPDDAPLARLEVINFMVQHNMIPAGHQREARNRALRKGGFSLTWPRQKA